MSALIHIIRHGRTSANDKRLYCGSTDISLSENGIREILEFKESGIYPEADLFITSGMKRAVETLRLIYGDIDHVVMEDLREYCFGDFEMQSHYELESRHDYQKWIADEKGDVCCPRGESRNGFYHRIFRGFEETLREIEKRKASSAVIVCHGGVIAAVMSRLFTDEKGFYGWQPKYGLGYTLHCSGGEITAYQKIDSHKAR